MISNSPTYLLTGTIVLYKENYDELLKTVMSFLDIPLAKKLYLIDNSPNNFLKDKFNYPEVEYVFIGENVGFGAGHNKVLKRIEKESDFHLILNPDVTFDVDVIPNLITKLEQEEGLALISPKVLYPNGSHQYTCRRYPTFLELMIRIFPLFKSVFPKVMNSGEYRELDLAIPFSPDFLHGCFLLFKTEKFIELNGFDERYFLYMEDVDICRKIDVLKFKKLYYPQEEVKHVLKKKSLKSVKLFFFHTSSVFQYFIKWGFSSKKS